MMSKAKDLFVELFSERPMLHPGDRDAVEVLRKAAELWRADGRFLSAGICMSSAVYAAWGSGSEVNGCLVRAMEDYRTCVDTQPADSLESLASLRKWTSDLTYVDPDLASRSRRFLQQELAQRLIRFFAETKHADSYLVKGFILKVDLDGSSEVSFPDYDVNGASETRSGAQLALQMPSAFRLLVGLGDYAGAQEVANRCPTAFTTPGLIGWQFAARGFLASEDAVELFTEASKAFAEDRQPSNEELVRQGGRWDSANISLWAKYFRARAVVARIIRQPNEAARLLREGSLALEGTESGWASGQVERFRLLVDALLQLVDGGAVDASRARQKLLGQKRIFGESAEDPVIEQFVDTAERAFEAFRADPARALVEGHLAVALDVLTRIPLIGSDVARAIAPTIGERALAEIFGPQRSWIYRTLEAITDEAQLRKIVLRLAQAYVPRYAQIRHGPLEYGKDIVAVFEKGGKRTLRMWQVKIGDINTPKWRESRAELEEMYLVPLESLHVEGEIHEREGILLCNGHANSNVEPVMKGWFVEQKLDHARKFQFVHLDALVNWIFDDRLINEFRGALDEIGIQP
jgi:hypothetical protein